MPRPSHDARPDRRQAGRILPGIGVALALAGLLIILSGLAGGRSSYNPASVQASAGACEDADTTDIAPTSDDLASFSPAGETVSGVCIKAGQNHSGSLTQNGNYDCSTVAPCSFTFLGSGTSTCYYTVAGIGTGTVTVTRNGLVDLACYGWP